MKRKRMDVLTRMVVAVSVAMLAVLMFAAGWIVAVASTATVPRAIAMVAPPSATDRLPTRRRIEVDQANGLRRQPHLHLPSFSNRIASDLELGVGVGLDRDLLDEVVEDELEILVLTLPD